MDAISETRLDMIKSVAVAFNVDPVLVCAVIEQESAWNQWSMRYEPMFFEKYIQPLLNVGTVHSMTEAMSRAASFGLMQVMGQVAREIGFTGRWLTELCDPLVGVKYGCIKLKKCLDKAGGNEHVALLLYNGGSNTSYPYEVLQRKDKYQ